MGWKGVVRAIETDMRRSARAAEKRQKLQKKFQAMDDAANAVSAYEDYLLNITSIHKGRISEVIDWKELANKNAPVEPTRSRYHQSVAQNNLKTFKPNLIHRVFKQDVKKYKKLQLLVHEAERKDENDYQDRLRHYNQDYISWERLKILATRINEKDAPSYVQAIEEFHSFDSIESLGVGIKFSVDAEGNVTVNIHVHGNEVIPKEKYSLRQSGTLSKKDMPKGEFYAFYQDYVCGCVLRAASEVFALLPVESILINANDELLDEKTGHIAEQTIVSAIIMKQTFERLNLNRVDPSDAMSNFLHNMKFKKTSGFDVVRSLSFDKIQ